MLALLPTLTSLHSTISNYAANNASDDADDESVTGRIDFSSREAKLKPPVTVVGLRRDVLLQFNRDLLLLVRMRCEDARTFVDACGEDGDEGDIGKTVNKKERKELIDRLNEQRVFLEKLRPIGKKVKYAVDKLLSDNNNNNEYSALDLEKKKHKPKPKAMMGGGGGGSGIGGGSSSDSDSDNDDDDAGLSSAMKAIKGGGLKKAAVDSDDENDDDDDGRRGKRATNSAAAKYVPPKMSSVAYGSSGGGNGGDGDDEYDNEDDMPRGKKRKIHSDRDYAALHAMSDVVREGRGAPEVSGTDGVGEGRASGRMHARSREEKERREEEARERFEEERFVRLVEGKKDKKKRKQRDRQRGGLKQAFGV